MLAQSDSVKRRALFLDLSFFEGKYILLKEKGVLFHHRKRTKIN
jgi:hypothetical protein